MNGHYGHYGAKSEFFENPALNIGPTISATPDGRDARRKAIFTLRPERGLPRLPRLDLQDGVEEDNLPDENALSPTEEIMMEQGYMTADLGKKLAIGGGLALLAFLAFRMFKK